MKIKLIWYFLPIVMFFACEDEEGMDELNIVGSWNITSQHDYENSNCTVQYESSLDTLCVQFAGGTYSNGNCDIIESVTFDYLLDGDAITFTEYAGTDSVATTTGVVNITNDILNVTVSDDSSCSIITASKL